MPADGKHKSSDEPVGTTDEEDRFIQTVVDFVRSDPVAFQAAGEELDQRYGVKATRSREGADPSRVDGTEHLAWAEVPLRERFYLTLDDLPRTKSLLRDEPKADREDLARYRLLLLVLRYDADRDEMRLPDGQPLTEFQSLRTFKDDDSWNVPEEFCKHVAGFTFADLADDVLPIDDDRLLSELDINLIRLARDAAGYLNLASQRPSGPVDADSGTTYGWARCCELVRATNQVFAYGALNEARVSRGRREMQWVDHRGDRFISVGDFLEWVRPILEDPVVDELRQLYTAIIVEINLRPSRVCPPTVTARLTFQKVFPRLGEAGGDYDP